MFAESLRNTQQQITSSRGSATSALSRIRGEIDFAAAFAELFASHKRDEWQQLILRAAELVRGMLSEGEDPATAVAAAEEILAPIGEAAKAYTIYCCGHAHIDMNWTWSWLETISVCHDTFATVDKLMDEFPELKYSQSQVSVYEAMEEYCPEIFEIIKKRVAEGRWESTASAWVEGDKNMASGESLCRHILYSKRYFRERFGLPYDAIKIDWQCDTFGHPVTLPAILSRGGVTRYYHSRAGNDNWISWWQSPDGSRILEFNDKNAYGGSINAETALRMVEYCRETGLEDFLFIYGMVDHGGGPTRKDLTAAGELSRWPIFPTIKLSTTDDFFSAIESKSADRIPVCDRELNFIFEGCYTSQSKVKRINRAAETLLPEVEAISIVARAATGFDYQGADLRKAWKLALFNSFHDILAGSSGHAAMEEAEARFHEAEAIAGSIRMRALRKLVQAVNTSSIAVPCESESKSTGDAVGYGAGDIRGTAGMSTWNMGAGNAEPLIVFNSLPSPRSGMVMVKVWDREIPHDRIVVRDEAGGVVRGQVVGSSTYVYQRGMNVLFPARDIPSLGYRTYSVSEGPAPEQPAGARIASPGVIENEHLRIEVDTRSGAIKHLLDKSTGADYVPDGQLLGLLELHHEVPHVMTSWVIGQVDRVTQFTEGGWTVDEASGGDSLDGDSLGMVTSTRIAYAGPHRASIRTMHKLNDSRISVEVILDAGSRSVGIDIKTRWREIGSAETGVPMLRMAFPVNIQEPKATYEIPFGSIERPVNGQEVPALRWADLSGVRADGDAPCGITLVNDSKYGFSAKDNVLSVSLVRASYDPDPVPEVGRHDIRLSLEPHEGSFSIPSAETRAADFNTPLLTVTTDFHSGPLPANNSFAEVLTPSVTLACLKKAEDSDSVLIRLYETEGKTTEARIRLSGIVEPNSKCAEVDLMEQPLADSSARMDGDTLVVTLPAWGIATVAI